MKKALTITAITLALSFSANAMEMDGTKMKHEGMNHKKMMNHDHNNHDHSAENTQMEKNTNAESQHSMHTETPKTSADISIDVNGLVCDFCAQAITKVFKKQDAVEDVKVDLSAKNIQVWLKDSENISDEDLTKLITDSGYNLVKINRS